MGIPSHRAESTFSKRTICAKVSFITPLNIYLVHLMMICTIKIRFSTIT